MKGLTIDQGVSVGAWRLPRLPLVKMPQFRLHGSADPERDAVEHYIHERFLKFHRAHINHFLPNIISLQCRESFSAAVGLSPANNHRLFAENYLTQPVEEVISEKLDFPVERQHILEIGNLVSSWKGSSLMLFILLSELIERLGYRWVVFTATREVESLLGRMHYAPVVLVDAKPEVLPDGGGAWGNYYNNNPRVMFGDVRPAVAAARNNPMYRSVTMLISAQVEQLCAEYRELNNLDEAAADRSV
jgi:hypothetical protein